VASVMRMMNHEGRELESKWMKSSVAKPSGEEATPADIFDDGHGIILSTKHTEFSFTATPRARYVTVTTTALRAN